MVPPHRVYHLFNLCPCQDLTPRVSPELKDLDLGQVNFTGYVEDLRPLFEQALVYVAPLRFGAGIKGKILEAINYGVPVVTTSIGAEGIGVVDGENILIADSAVEFCEAVVKLHRDEELWGELRDKGREYVETSFSQQAFQARVDQVMKKLLK